MLRTKCCLVAICVGGLLPSSQVSLLGQLQEPANADEVIGRYIEAIGGADRISRITTFMEKGEVSWNATAPAAGRPPTPQQQRGTFEFYYKAPNFRYSLLRAANNVVAEMHGCDGEVAWQAGPDPILHESKPKSGTEDACQKRREPRIPPYLPDEKRQLKGRKTLGDRSAWVVKVVNPRADFIGTYYYDTQTYLLLRSSTVLPAGSFVEAGKFTEEETYSDYREIDGIKVPFKVIRSTEFSDRVTTLGEVTINAPIDDAQFKKPIITVGSENPNFAAGKAAPPANPDNTPPHPYVETEIPVHDTPKPSPAPARVPPPNLPDFILATKPELETVIPLLKGLKPPRGDEDLTDILKKVGQKTVELSQKIPNLISLEEVVESELNLVVKREKFSYLLVPRRSPRMVTLEEYRVDLQTGAKLETDDGWKPASSDEDPSKAFWADLEHATRQVGAREGGEPPLSQGFASMWVRFYPANRTESNFRYLGRQKMNHHQTLVLAFAQKPASVRLPGEVRFENKSLPIYYQGVAWVDASDFRIVRLRTDLLSPISEFFLDRLTTDALFAESPVTGLPSPLWLPREVEVNTVVNGMSFGDQHRYSQYRLFRVKTKIVLGQ